MIPSMRFELQRKPEFRPQVTLASVGEPGQFGTVHVELSALGDSSEPAYSVDLGHGLRYDLLERRLLLEAFPGQPLGAAEIRGWGTSTNIEQHGSALQIVTPEGQNNVSLTSRGDTLTIDPPGADNELVLRRHGNRISLDPSPAALDSIDVRPTADGLLIDHYGPKDTSVTRQGNTTRIDRPGLGNEIVVERSGDKLIIDAFGWGNTTVIQRNGASLSIDPPGVGNGTDIQVQSDALTIDLPGLGNSINFERRDRWARFDPSGIGNEIDIQRRS
jgi:hypothetical protein